MVRTFLKILLGGTALFMLASVAQEWDFFSSAWFGRSAQPPPLTDGQKRGAAEAVYLYAKMTSHLYGSGGDARFAERLNGSPAVVEETLAEVDYLRRNGRVQDPVLMKLEVRGVEPLGEGVEVRTREFWVTKTYWLGTEEESDPVRSQVAFVKYRLEPDGAGWRVMAWDFDAPPEDGTPAGPAPQVPPAAVAAH